jgi:hypothetical protein
MRCAIRRRAARSSCRGARRGRPAVRGGDTGIGIDEQHISRLTERFYRVDKSRSRETQGTGLGLAIVKHVLLRHGGRLKISSTPGQGSTFTASLPNTSLPGVAYTIGGTAYSGSTQSDWSGAGTRNSITLQNQSGGTAVCNSQNLCSGTSATWDHGTQGPVYVIFQPQSQ